MFIKYCVNCKLTTKHTGLGPRYYYYYYYYDYYRALPASMALANAMPNSLRLMATGFIAGMALRAARRACGCIGEESKERMCRSRGCTCSPTALITFVK